MEKIVLNIEELNIKASGSKEASKIETSVEFEFLEEPDPDYFCPVSAELLVKPVQTTCCGHHLSLSVASMIIKDGKPCPLCMNETFALNDDKYFKRKVNELKVYCLNKEKGCVWTGELGDINAHATSCPKRPWKCPYCDFESLYEEGPNNHTPSCNFYPVPCCNRCDVGTIPRHHAQQHLLECPLQLVDCEFVDAGCNVRVPRKDLARHLTENFQQHLMTATLYNIRLTKEKLEEKDNQISFLQEHIAELQSQFKESQTLIVKKLCGIEQAMVKLDTKLSSQLTRLHCQLEDTLRLNGFAYNSFSLKNFKKHQAKGVTGSWLSESFYNFPQGYLFKLGIDTNGYREAAGTHISACLWLGPGEHDKHLKWPIKCDVYLLMLNQRRDHGHHMVIGKLEYSKAPVSYEHRVIGTTCKFFPLASLGLDSNSEAVYLLDDSLQFRMYIRVKS